MCIGFKLFGTEAAKEGNGNQSSERGFGKGLFLHDSLTQNSTICGHAAHVSQLMFCYLFCSNLYVFFLSVYVFFFFFWLKKEIKMVEPQVPPLLMYSLLPVILARCAQQGMVWTAGLIAVEFWPDPAGPVQRRLTALLVSLH